MASPTRLNWRGGLSTSLPIVLMGLLAAGTGWLVRHTPKPGVPRLAAAATHEVDYEMHRFVGRRYGADGVQRVVVEGQVLRHYADNGVVEIDAVRARGVDTMGRRIHATARRGISNAQNTEIELLGQASVVREAAAASADPAVSRKLADERTELRGEALWLYPEAQRVRSDIPVTLLSDSAHIDAGTLDYDGKLGVAQMGHGVRGTYLSAPPAGSASGAAP